VFMNCRTAIFALLAVWTSTSVAQQLDISGAWNGTVCKGSGDMIVSGSPTLVPTAGYVHMELTPANSGNPDVRYDVDITIYDAKGAVLDHHPIPYEPIHYGHGVQPNNSHQGDWFFQADSRNPTNRQDGRVVSISFSDKNGTKSGDGTYDHYVVSSNGRSQYIGEVWIAIRSDGQSAQQYIAAHPHPCP
jgi:hypothetical protein